MRLDGRVAIVTGGSRGIGRAIALAFAGEGARIAVVGKNKSHCDEAVARILKSGGDAIGIQADISLEKDVASMAGETIKRFGRVDILVNCAAVGMGYRTVAEMTLEEWNHLFSVNLTGTFLCCRAVLPQMTTQRSGKIINLSSIGGRKGDAGRSAYRGSKAAIINFTECLASEVKEFGIDVNAICPGAVQTDMSLELNKGKMPPSAMPPEDIAAIALFLASDESRAITGAAIDAFGPSNPLFGVSLSLRPVK